jgi:hypothetical protein
LGVCPQQLGNLHQQGTRDIAGMKPILRFGRIAERRLRVPSQPNSFVLEWALDSGLLPRLYDSDMRSIDARPPEKEPHQKIIARMGKTCCSSPAAICYWFCASLIAWGLLSFVGIYWRPFRALSATTIYLAMAAGCAANWFRNRTLHCGITGPLFLLAGLVSLLSETRFIHVEIDLALPFVLTGAGLAFLLEWRYAGRSE